MLLHTSWKFNGLAGLLTLLTLIVVASGFVGRYIYTALPRSADGAELDGSQVQEQIAGLQAQLTQTAAVEPALAQQVEALVQISADTPPGTFGNWRLRRRWRVAERRVRRELGPGALTSLQACQQLINRQRALRRQANSLAQARRLLSLWHAVHIPIGMVLFAVAFVHIAAAIYYATLLR